MIYATTDLDQQDRIQVGADIRAFTDRPTAEAWLLENARPEPSHAIHIVAGQYGVGRGWITLSDDDIEARGGAYADAIRPFRLDSDDFQLGDVWDFGGDDGQYWVQPHHDVLIAISRPTGARRYTVEVLDDEPGDTSAELRQTITVAGPHSPAEAARIALAEAWRDPAGEEELLRIWAHVVDEKGLTAAAVSMHRSEAGNDLRLG